MRGGGKRDGKRAASARPRMAVDVRERAASSRKRASVLVFATRAQATGVVGVVVERVTDKARLRGRADAERVKELKRQTFRVAGFRGAWKIVDVLK